jgi:hypothetical protein
MLQVAAAASDPASAMDALNAFGTSPKHTAKTRVEMGEDDEDELEEDEGFISASSSLHTGSTNLSKNGERNGSCLEQDPSSQSQLLNNQDDRDANDEEDDLEEDPMFAAAAAATCASSSSTTLHAHAPASHQQQQQDDSLSSASQLIRSITGKDMAVSHLDLGRHSDPHRQLCATTYSGKKIYFKRQKGNALIGDVRVHRTSLRQGDWLILLAWDSARIYRPSAKTQRLWPRWLWVSYRRPSIYS